MEYTKNEIPNHISIFFKELTNYIDTPLYFYGSIQRNDYFPGNSDIDVDIFTDNPTSMISKLQHFLHIKKSKFKKIIWRLNDVVAFGHKVMYKNEEGAFSVEFSIYNENIKNQILKEHNRKNKLPFYISWIMILLKIIYYKLYLIERNTFRYIKGKLLLLSTNSNREEDFLVN
jgi:hypothetical protein